VFKAEDALAAARQLPGPVYVVKAQIHAGGRGKGSFKEAAAGEKGGVRIAKSIEEAETIASQDPFIKSGTFTYEMHEWTVNEGGIPLFVSLSDSTVTIR